MEPYVFDNVLNGLLDLAVAAVNNVVSVAALLSSRNSWHDALLRPLDLTTEK